MKTKKGFLTLFASFLLLVSTFTMVYRPSANAQIIAGNLTGIIFDHGVDTNRNGLYDYLEIDFEVTVSIAGQFYLSVYTLQDAQGRNIYIYNNNWLPENLTIGIQYLNITVSGPQIFNSRLNPRSVSNVQLYYISSTSYSEYMGGIDNIALSRMYNYTEFDPPSAYLTGNILDHGVDTNGNGLYDYLEIGIEINVTVAGEFQTDIGSLTDKNGGYIGVNNSSQRSLDVGLQYMNVSFSGPQIFSSRLNPQNVSSIQLVILNSTNHIGNFVDEIYDVPLSRIYNYAEFDPPSAYLTGNATDRGADTDGNGLFDYLQVGVEVNVTQVGDYSVTAGGLSSNGGGFFSQIFSDSQMDVEIFQPGIHTVYMNFSGPGIRESQINPANVIWLSLQDTANYRSLDYLNSIPLSKTYDNTLFDAPSKNTQVNIKVYPDGTVAIDGALNYTRMYPENTYYPKFNATMGFSTTGNTTVGASNGTVAFQENPYIIDNSLEEHFLQTYENGLLNETSSTSMILTPEMRAIYPFNTTDFNLDAACSGGLFNVNVEGSTVLPTVYGAISPFNMTDTTVRTDFNGNLVTGNITFHTIPGLEFADVTLDFSGNRTSLQFVGNVNVTYANYGYFQINKTDLDQKIADLNANFTGTGPESLYNETDGNLNCSNFVLAETPWADPTQGANVEYNVTIVGNFTAALASLMYPEGSYYFEGYRGFEYALLESTASSISNGSVVLNYYHNSQTAQISVHLTVNAQELANQLIQLVPPTISQLPPMGLNETQVDAFLKIANATTFALTNASASESYSSTDGRFSANSSLAANGTQLKQDILPFLPDISPSNMHDIFESFFNTTFGNTASLDSTLDVTNGTGTFNATVTYQGDLESEANHIKEFYVATLFNTGEYPSYVLSLNETELNINNLQVQADLGQNWMYLNFSGLSFKPPLDKVDELTFKLKTWLEALSHLTPPPKDFEQFTVTITGESRGNETVILSKPYNVPPPDNFSDDYRNIVWNNASLSSLQELTFLIAAREQANFNGQTYDFPILTNSTVKSFLFDPSAKRISFNVTGELGAGFCNVTIPRNLLDASALSDWTVTFDGNVLTPNEFNITQNNDYVFVYLNYTHSEHVITISGTQLIPELQPDILPVVLAISLVIIVIATIKRKKLETLKTRLLQTLISSY